MELCLHGTTSVKIIHFFISFLYGCLFLFLFSDAFPLAALLALRFGIVFEMPCLMQLNRIQRIDICILHPSSDSLIPEATETARNPTSFFLGAIAGLL